ncbi:MAG: leucyl aminopeptidase [Clostridia bacterium]|nr:aminopeptidase [Lachnospiraceae bacterium]NCC01483.1 leucyl aminopeptidase [Clostridia bacterium]NCD03274.1 leucyl aminopeptidase [Clostridia bacterium]
MAEDVFLKERYELALERIREIPDETKEEKDYFVQMALWMLKLDDYYKWLENPNRSEKSLKEWQALYDDFYRPMREDYEKSYANPEFACHIFGKDLGRLFSFLSSEIYRCLPQLVMRHMEAVVVLWELFLEIHTAFVYGAEEHMEPEAKDIQKMIYWSINDYSEEMVSWRIHQQQEPDFSPIKSIIMEADLSDLRYLYRFGEYISDSERKTAQHMNELSQEEIDKIAATFVDGYFRGFEMNRIPLENKKYVTVRGSIGFERVFRSAIVKFRERGLEPIFFPASTHILNRRQVAIGYQGKSVNPQFEFDHCKDKALYYDKALANQHLEALKKAYEECGQWIRANGGPACFETFGEEPFSPVIKEACYQLDDKQKKLEMEYANLQVGLTEQYMKSSEISFTIIAFPTPDIGVDYKEIFDEIVKVNTLDNDVYRDIQQKLVNALDQAEYVYVRGKHPNKTVMKVRLHPIKHPESETVFENCCADVNIPVGEVFTSPMLTGTEGLLHATGVYLNGIFFKDLQLRFTDGQIVGYSCGNDDDAAANHRLVRDYLLAGRESLPLGEFAIGTNTTAYAAAQKYKITDRLPILIVEKMGPHFAIGDTCYSRAEDHAVYNPDGKEIIARENEISARRKEEGFQAYFNCHTDITIPYDEIGEIFAVDRDENMISIIKDGRFVLNGTELLNGPLIKLNK